MGKRFANFYQYYSRKYNHRVRWMNFWHQIDEVYSLEPQTILEIGKGSGLVGEHLKKMGYDVYTADIDSNTSPDIVASVEKLPIGNNQFDVVLAAEILEHLPIEKAKAALAEIKRVCKKGAIISLPYSGTRFFFKLKLPKLPEIVLFIPIPYFWRKHKLSKSGHYWEVGKKGFSRKRIRVMFKEAGFKISKEKIFPDDFNHLFFILEKN